jgi:hypothetical protein
MALDASDSEDSLRSPLPARKRKALDLDESNATDDVENVRPKQASKFPVESTPEELRFFPHQPGDISSVSAL